MPARKRAQGKKGGSFNLSLIIIIVILIAILSYALSYLFINDASTKEVVVTNRNQTEQKQADKEKSSSILLIEGNWYSEYDGAILTISTSVFSLEFPGVDGSEKVTGSVEINDNEVIFTNGSSAKKCIDKPGKYSWKVKNRNNLVLTKISDPCTNRIKRMISGWERF